MKKINTEQMRSAYVQLVSSMAPTTFVTLALQRDGTENEVRDLAKAYCARMDSMLLGGAWSLKPPALRTDGVFFVEHCASNVHLHGVLRFKRGEFLALGKATKQVWSKLCPSGTVDVQEIYDARGVANYCTKEMGDFAYDDHRQVILLRELMGSGLSLARARKLSI